ncbi:MAG: MFS transporter [Deltaproteobacteria bacterium]|nr:MFS transporter [Deltaproteobacteria bacterium]
MTEQSRTDIKVISALTLVHFAGDFYVSFVNPLLPVFVDRFGLTLAQVGLIAGLMRVLAFIVQPGVGYFADRYRSRIFILGGPLLSIVFISFVGWAHSFWDLLLFIAVGAIGSSMFHPSMAGMISNYAGRHFGLSLSIFHMGGTFAFGVGPLFIAAFVSRWGLEAVPWTAIPGIVLMLVLFRMTPRPLGEGLRGQGFVGAIREAFGEAWKPVLLIWVVMVLRTFIQQSFLTFTPVLYAREGHSLVSIGLVVSLFTMAGSISGLFAGHLSDRIGFKPIFYVCFTLAAPALLLMLLLKGAWVYLAAALAGSLIFATVPLGLAMAQKLAPRGKSMVSSLMMGLAQGVGGMMAPLVGSLADLFSIRSVLFVLAVIPLLSLILVGFFPEKRLRGGIPVG